MSDEDPAGVRFLDRRAGQCAWPLWGETIAIDDKRCCGAPTPTEQTYCARHRARSKGQGTPSERQAHHALIKLSAKDTVPCPSET